MIIEASIESYIVESSTSLDMLDELVSLDRDFFPQPWDKNQWISFMNSNRKILISIISYENLCGFSLFEFDSISSQSHLHKIVINKNICRKGLGLKLLTHAVSKLSDLGVSDIYLEVDTSNEAAMALYEKIGLKNIHEKKKFYSNGNDAYIYTGHIKTLNI